MSTRDEPVITMRDPVAREQTSNLLLMPSNEPPLVSGRRGLMSLLADILAASEDMSS